MFSQPKTDYPNILRYEKQRIHNLMSIIIRLTNTMGASNPGKYVPIKPTIFLYIYKSNAETKF